MSLALCTSDLDQSSFAKPDLKALNPCLAASSIALSSRLQFLSCF